MQQFTTVLGLLALAVTPALCAAPVVTAVTNAAVLSGARASGLVPGEAITIWGTGFCINDPQTKQCPTASEPLVQIGTSYAAIFFSSATQINAEVPTTQTYGTVNLLVASTSTGYSNQLTFPLVSGDPALYSCTLPTIQPLVQQPPSYSLVGTCGYPKAALSKAAWYLVLWGNGFAPWGGAAPSCTATIDGTAVKVWCGQSSNASEWQINLTGPAFAAGAHNVAIMVNGTAVWPSIFTIQTQ